VTGDKNFGGKKGGREKVGAVVAVGEGEEDRCAESERRQHISRGEGGKPFAKQGRGNGGKRPEHKGRGESRMNWERFVHLWGWEGTRVADQRSGWKNRGPSRRKASEG